MRRVVILMLCAMPLGSAVADEAYLDLRRVPAVTGDATAGQAKAQVCNACHGENGISPAPIFPNLQGLTTEYLYWKLVEYKRSQNPESAMTPIVMPLSDQDMRDLAAYYAQLKADAAAPPVAAPPEDSADAERLLQAGERIFTSGDPERGVPPCQGCHGADGSGYPLAKAAKSARLQTYYLTYPALKGQQPDYVIARLTHYRDKQDAATSNGFIMQSVASGLDDDSIRAVATWLASLH